MTANLIRGYYNLTKNLSSPQYVEDRKRFAELFVGSDTYSFGGRQNLLSDLPKSKQPFRYDLNDELYIHKSLYDVFMRCYERWKNPDYELSI